MKILYQTYDFFLEFERSVFTDKYPSFVLRSVLGKELKNFACILKGKPCEECPLKFHCAYSYIFETPLKKDNEALMGRNKGTHPFTISCQQDFGINTKSLIFRLSLFGRGIEYFPYIYYSFMKSGENGVFRERVPYKITKILSDGFAVNEGGKDELSIPEPKSWCLNTYDRFKPMEIRLNFITPVRLKINNSYTSDINYRDIIFSAFKKAEVMTKMYGNYENVNIKDFKLSDKNEDVRLKWKEYKRYSGRQKTEMILGGNIGYTVFKGDFTDFEISVLKSAEIFGLGKNTSFGFGKIELEGL